MRSLIKHQLVRRFPMRQWVRLRGDVADALALQRLAPLSRDYLPWSESSIRPGALVSILNDTYLNQRNLIVECGGGISTIYIAQLLQKIQRGKLITIEHDGVWVDMLGKILEDKGIGGQVEIIHAPLAANSHAINGLQWYDQAIIDAALRDKNIDLLLVDGPLAYGPGMGLSRYPAVPGFQQYLSDNYVIYLDDIHRDGEFDILRRWSKHLNLPYRSDLVGGNIGIIRSGQAQNV